MRNKRIFAALCAVMMLAGCGGGAAAPAADTVTETEPAPVQPLTAEEYKTQLREIYEEMVGYLNELSAIDFDKAETWEWYIELMDKYISIYGESIVGCEKIIALVPPDEYAEKHANIITETEKLLAMEENVSEAMKAGRDFYYTYYIRLGKDEDDYKSIIQDITDTAIENININETESDAELRKAYFSDILTDKDNLNAVFDECYSGISFDDPEYNEMFMELLDRGDAACDAFKSRVAPDYIKNRHRALCDVIDKIKKDFSDIREMYATYEKVNSENGLLAQTQEITESNLFDTYVLEVINEE